MTVVEPRRVARPYVGPQGADYFALQVGAGDALASTMARTYQPRIDRSATVLDFGCGGGSLLSRLVCGRRLGVEPLAESRALASSRGLEVSPSLDEIPDACVDVAISHHALEHCAYPFTELMQLHRVLKPRGKLVVMVPIEDWRVERRANEHDINHHLFAWTPLLMGNLLIAVGFTNVVCNVVSEAWDPRFVRLPWGLFRLISRLEAAILKRRQLLATATRP
jgi:SAM-dependent methyltransferase